MAVILVTSRSFSDGSLDLVGRLAEAGHEVVRGPSDHSLDALAEPLVDAVAWIAGTGAVTDAHLAAAPHLKVVARYGVGYEAVDVEAATRRGIVVTNGPGANSDAVADHAVGLMLALLRGTVDGDRRVRAGDWSVYRGRELGSLTVGIVGFGRIGQGVARRLSGFGTRIIAADPFLPDDVVGSLGAEPAELSRIGQLSDVLSLHAPGGETLITADWLATARPGIALVNTARPDLVDEGAVAAALHDRRVSGFAADTLAGDTRAEGSPLLDPALRDRVVVTPHLGAQTVEAVDNMGRLAVENALAVLEGRTPPNPVNSVQTGSRQRPTEAS